MDDVTAVIEAYLQQQPSEAPRLDRIRQWSANTLAEHGPAAWFDRQNFTGHITASGFVIDRDAARVLMIWHRSLERWLQPGGHIEPGDASLPDAARREVEEETGVPGASLQMLNAGLPFDIDSHDISARPARNEPAHVHHDIRFAFAADGTQSLTPRQEEVTAARWVPLAELADDAEFAPIIRKLVTMHRG